MLGKIATPSPHPKVGVIQQESGVSEVWFLIQNVAMRASLDQSEGPVFSPQQESCR